MKYFLAALLIVVVVSNASAQNGFVRYYDSIDIHTTQENAAYYTEFVKKDSEYITTSYYLPSKELHGKGCFGLDTVTLKSKGLILKYHKNGNLKSSSLFTHKSKAVHNYTYYESGKIEDSTVYGKDWNDYETYSFGENGKLLGHSYYNKQTKTDESVGFDEKGEIIPNYIFDKKPEFPGNYRGWQQYLARNLNANVPAEKGAKDGKYTVIVSFKVDSLGNVSNIQAENNPGYGTKEEAIRVIRKSPKWVPAIKRNKPTEFRHRQSITFMVSSI